MIKDLMLLTLLATSMVDAQERGVNDVPSTSSVPAAFQGVWGKLGRCDVPRSRLTITGHAAGWGKGPFNPVIYDPTDQVIRWSEEYDTANFELGGRADILIYNKEGFHMPEGREGYAKCVSGLRRVRWKP